MTGVNAFIQNVVRCDDERGGDATLLGVRLGLGGLGGRRRCVSGEREEDQDEAGGAGHGSNHPTNSVWSIDPYIGPFIGPLVHLLAPHSNM